MPPRTAANRRAATPARSTRAASQANEQTPASGRYVRQASRVPAASKEIVENTALPEIATQQSYAYGSSRAPVLPEVLKAGNLSMQAVANRLEAAANDAHQHMQADERVRRENPADAQDDARTQRTSRRSSRQTSQEEGAEPLVNGSTDHNIRGESRVRNWVEDGGDLDTIDEEELDAANGFTSTVRHRLPNGGVSARPESSFRDSRAGTHDSDPSEFPTISFDHSYAYEQGLRGPRLGPAYEQEKKFQARSMRQPGFLDSTGRAVRNSIKSVRDSILTRFSQLYDFVKASLRVIGHGLHRIWSGILTLFREFKYEDIGILLVMSFLLFLSGFGICMIFWHFCDPSNPTILGRGLQHICGQCSRAGPRLPQSSVWDDLDMNINRTDLSSLVSAMRQVESRVNSLDSRLSSHLISSSDGSIQVDDILHLKNHQNQLADQMRDLQYMQQTQYSSDTADNLDMLHDVPSPLVSAINFFSLDNGAIVNPYLTSPTRIAPLNIFARTFLSSIGIKRYISQGPVSALQSWTNENDCWCAAPTKHDHATSVPSDQDMMRLGIHTSQSVLPQELVIEFYPANGTLHPESAPREIEIWADFAATSSEDWEVQGIEQLIKNSPDIAFPLSNPTKCTWARIGTATYQLAAPPEEDSDEISEQSASEQYKAQRGSQKMTNLRGMKKKEQKISHVQKFKLDVNRAEGGAGDEGERKVYADKFMVRVKANHGGDFTCLYRVRLLGLPRHKQA